LPNQFKFLFVHLKVHKALKWLTDNHPSRAGISFSANNGFQDMETYDWSRVKVAVVMSVPGTYDGPEQMDQFGICRLGRVLCDQGWKPKLGEKTVAEFQVSPTISQHFPLATVDEIVGVITRSILYRLV
jgi:tyrosyl-DNA phosphodiesterase-1